MIKKLFLLFYITITSLFSSPVELPLNLTHPHLHATSNIDIYEDTSGKLDINHILELPKEAFSHTHDNAFGAIFSDSAYWYKIELINPSESPITKSFVIEPPWIDYLQINVISPSGEHIQYEIGNTFNYSQRSINNHLINQSHSFEQGDSTVYIQMKTRDPFVFILSLLDTQEFLEEQNVELLSVGLVFGVMIAMILYNLFLFIALRDPSYAYFVLYIASFLLMSFTYNGYSFKFIFYDNPELQNIMQSTSIYFFAISTLLFAQSFLNIKNRSELCNKSFNIITLLLIVSFILSAALGGYAYHIKAAMVSIIIVSLYIVMVSLYSWYNSNPTARFFVIGTTFGFTGIIITSFTYFGLFPYSSLSVKAVDIGMTLNAILLSIALADRIREDQKMRIKAEEETKTKSLFLSNMSHEIRTPINAVFGMNNLLLKTDLDKKQRNFVEIIEKSSKNLIKIIDDILDYSKIEAGKLTIDKTDFNLIELINTVIDLMKTKAEEKNIQIKVIHEADFKGNIHADSLRIYQVLTNLINNAIKFTDSGEINVHVKKILENRFRFEIEDTGIGISKEKQKKLFNSFSQADCSTTRNYGGTGLGLAISKQLVEIMDGKIWVESEVGEGSRFIFEIALEEIHNIDVSAEELSNIDDEIMVEQTTNPLKGKKILLVEDNEFNQDVIIFSLEKSELTIDVANNGQEAVDMFNDDYELILMDIQMPIMDGYEASKLIKEKNSNIPIIALSANAMKEDIENIKNIYMNEYLTKPIDFKSLNALLLKYLSK